MNKEYNEVNDQTKVPLWKEKPLPRFDVSTDEWGNVTTTPIRQSPLTQKTILAMRQSAFVMEQLERSRAVDLRAHADYMRYIRPILEQKHGVKAEELFRGKGNGVEANRLYREDKLSYELLRESLYWG